MQRALRGECRVSTKLCLWGGKYLRAIGFAQQRAAGAATVASIARGAVERSSGALESIRSRHCGAADVRGSGRASYGERVRRRETPPAERLNSSM